ncbi:hypothetical protein P22_3557 [Propionispora sp. 2/2-37]|uniref:DUF4911 domain-containing protein n=1 Tax=Propionispora sp. 2/2-37 TaxID=1677858 RepID=UPI0006BB867A|nr:DUF4911 domain-containing protein [Propionispora sp. 2/2-37]CUH97427.1 hypothetical protein P22_3557 [Propionispora sp. 2/2-37]
MNKEAIYIRVLPSDINYINRIMEGYEYLGIVTTINRSEGILKVRVTPDTYDEVEMILSHLPVTVEMIPPVA